MFHFEEEIHYFTGMEYAGACGNSFIPFRFDSHEHWSSLLKLSLVLPRGGACQIRGILATFDSQHCESDTRIASHFKPNLS